MPHKNEFDPLNATLQDMLSSSQSIASCWRFSSNFFLKCLFGDEIEACSKHSHLWRFVLTKKLFINMYSILR